MNDLSIYTANDADRQAEILSKSNMVPKSYQGSKANCIIAIDLALRLGCSPLMVMQNSDTIHGKPSFSSKFLIAMVNRVPQFRGGIRYEYSEKMDSCRAYCIDAETGEKVFGPKVTMQTAKDEGWLTKAGSKWKTMPELMLAYRAAAFFARIYCPESTMGLLTTEEEIDRAPERVVQEEPVILPLQDEKEHMGVAIIDGSEVPLNTISVGDMSRSLAAMSQSDRIHFATSNEKNMPDILTFLSDSPNALASMQKLIQMAAATVVQLPEHEAPEKAVQPKPVEDGQKKAEGGVLVQIGDTWLNVDKTEILDMVRTVDVLPDEEKRAFFVDNAEEIVRLIDLSAGMDDVIAWLEKGRAAHG